jgi:hypothetical protein
MFQGVVRMASREERFPLSLLAIPRAHPIQIPAARRGQAAQIEKSATLKQGLQKMHE